MSRIAKISIITLIVIILAIGAVFLFAKIKNPTIPVTTSVRNLFPFGTSSIVLPPSDTGTDIAVIPPSETGPYVPPRLRKITDFAVAGLVPLSKERILPQAIPAEGTATFPVTTPAPITSKKSKTPAVPKVPTEIVTTVRFVARSNAAVYESDVDKKDIERLTVTYIPRIYEAYFGNAGDDVILRYLSADYQTVETYLAHIPKRADLAINKDLTGEFLPENITEVAVSPDMKKYFYLFSSGETTNGIMGTFGTTAKSQIFSHGFSEWLPTWTSAGTIVLTTKASGTANGYAYGLDIVKKTLTKYLGATPGAYAILSPNAKTLLYSAAGTSVALNTKPVGGGDPISLGIKTLADKCVWNASSTVMYCAVPTSIGTETLPDSWYQGTISFSDLLWKIDLTNGVSTLLSNPEQEVKTSLDITNLAVDPSESYLFFINKKDATLWSYSLK